MGSYSYFDWEEIRVIDSKGLTDFLFKIKNKDKGGDYDYMYKDFLEGVIDGKAYSFESWDGLKLISYWYHHQVTFLELLGKYIEGEVHFNFETNEESAIIKFSCGKTIFGLGGMDYKDVPINELTGDKVTLKELLKDVTTK